MGGFLEENVKRHELGEDVLYFKDFSSDRRWIFPHLLCFSVSLCGSAYKLNPVA